MCGIREKLRKINMEGAGKRGCLLLLCAVMLFSLLPVPASAAYEEYNNAIPSTAIGGGSKLDPGNTLVHKDNAFVLRILFGSYVNDLIQYYRIAYEDADGYIHYQMFFPNYKDLHYYGCLELAAENNTWWFGDILGYWPNNFDYAATYAIDRTVEFYFEPEYMLKKIVSVDIFCSKSSSAANEAAISEIRIFRVKELYGLGRVGGMSDEYYVRFLGECMVSATFSKRLSWSSDDKIFQLTYKKDEYYLVEENKPYDSYNAAELVFELSIADIYGAGIEADALPNGKMGKSIKEALFPESLALTIQYTDVNGKKRTSHIPVAMSTLLCAQKNISISSGVKKVTDNSSILNQKVHGILQQGETVVFSAVLPDIATIDKATLVLGNEEVMKKTDLYQTAADKTEHDKRLKQEQEGLSFASLKIYDGSKVNVTSYVKDYQLVQQVTGEPIYFTGAISYLGTNVLPDSSYVLPLVQYTGTERLNSPGKAYTYLFSFETDTPAAAGTKDEIFCEIHYVALDGSAKTYGPVSVKAATKDYFGYWPGSGGDACYSVGAGAGGTICLPISITDADYFSGVTLSLDEKATDDWQVKNIKIEAIRSLAVRSVSADALQVAGTTVSDRTYSRNNTTKNISPKMSEPVLVQAKEKKKVTFAASGTSVSDGEEDWRENLYSMSYEDASQYLGFEKARECYEVTVNVAGDINSDIENETCGSTNYFYFQLIFEEGVSGYVLANQQLPSDSFLAGTEAKFRIYTNQNYGAVTAIRVIPDDLSEKTDAFDKLKVSSISVSLSSDEGMDATWVAEMGEGVWIDIDYHDEGERNSPYGQAARTESELAQTFPITKKGYKLKTLFAVTTKGFTGEKFSGQVSYSVKYETTSGEVKSTGPTSMVADINSYANKVATPKTYTIGGKSVNGEEIDFGIMFRDNKTDRFTVEMEDVTRIDSITINVKNEKEGAWLISNVAVYQIMSPGVLVLNSSSEYQKTSKVRAITGTSSDTTYQLDYKPDGNGGLTISFPENEIDIDMANGAWTSAVTYVPKSKDDTLNIYAYMKYSQHKPSTYRLTCSTAYKVISASGTDENGQDYTVADGLFNFSCSMTGDDEKEMFYALGVKASGFSSISSMSFGVYSLNAEVAQVSHVIVEHIRSGVIINTYYLDFRGHDAEYGCTASPSIPSSAEGRQQQAVTFKITDESALSRIEKDTSDLALCLNYTSENDPTGKVYSSPYIFLSDLGFTYLDAGAISSVTFGQSYVKDITGVTFAAVGNATRHLTIECAMVENNVIKQESVPGSTSGEKQEVCTNLNCYSFGFSKTEPVTLSPMTMVLSGSTSSTSAISNTQSQRHSALLSFSFKTADAGSTYESGTGGPIRMAVVYDCGAVTFTKQYEDLRQITATGSYAAGKTAVVTIMLPEYDSIRWVELTPYDEDDTSTIVSWKLDSLTVNETTKGKTVPIVRNDVNKTAYSDNPLKVGLASIVLDVAVYPMTASGEILQPRNFRASEEAKETEAILIEQGQKIELLPTITGSIDEVTVACKKVSTTADGKQATEDATNLISVATQFDVVESVIFSPGDSIGDYQVIFTSKENEKITLTVTVSVKEPPKETTTEETSGEKTGEETSDEKKSAGEASGEEKPASEQTGGEQTGEGNQGGTP